MPGAGRRNSILASSGNHPCRLTERALRLGNLFDKVEGVQSHVAAAQVRPRKFRAIAGEGIEVR
jgi:hypothetical protein